MTSATETDRPAKLRAAVPRPEAGRPTFYGSCAEFCDGGYPEPAHRTTIDTGRPRPRHSATTGLPDMHCEEPPATPGTPPAAARQQKHSTNASPVSAKGRPAARTRCGNTEQQFLNRPGNLQDTAGGGGRHQDGMAMRTGNEAPGQARSWQIPAFLRRLGAIKPRTPRAHRYVNQGGGGGQNGSQHPPWPSRTCPAHTVTRSKNCARAPFYGELGEQPPL